jgi:hypothetical protein
MGKKKKSKILNIDKPSKGPTRRIINLTNQNPYKHEEPESIGQSCIPEEINSTDLPTYKKSDFADKNGEPLETEERNLNDSDDEKEENEAKNVA